MKTIGHRTLIDIKYTIYKGKKRQNNNNNKKRKEKEVLPIIFFKSALESFICYNYQYILTKI